MKNEILKLKAEKKAVILAHYYQREEIQAIADFVGDSLELAKKAKETDAETIIFCGVSFMAETAKILSLHKKVYQPSKHAGCSMADMADADMIKALRQEYPKAKVVCYVNSTAAVKAESDICCTSSNAVDIVKGMSSQDIIFVPDRNLGAYVASQVTDKNIILWDGHCYVHGLLQASTVKAFKLEHEDALVVAHPECCPDVLQEADFVGSTSKMLAYISSSSHHKFIVLTEAGIASVLKEKNPQKEFLFPKEALYCRTMKMNRLEDVLAALKGQVEAVEVAPEIARDALKSLTAMFEVK